MGMASSGEVGYAKERKRETRKEQGVGRLGRGRDKGQIDRRTC